MDLRQRVQESLSGTHTIERELGGGGMSRVFVASEHRLGRKVVVKVLAPELAAAISAERFEREIRLAASLQQANILPVISAGEMEGLPYYTMPFVEGESLRARLASGPLSLSQTVDILRDVAKALSYAHERGVVHRDIKPDNILLSGRTAVVADFGIAKAIAAAQERPVGATLTQMGTSVGTPAYMAPEQAAGDPDTDHRADVYAFGCMAYEMIVGHPPFYGRPPHKLLAAHMGETPPPILELRPDCPPALAQLVMHCLAKDPNDRPESADDMLRQLDLSTSTSGASVPASVHSGLFLRAMGLYAGAFIGVAIVARLLVDTQGLPEWIFAGALVVMALGFPVLLFTGYTQYVARRIAMATPTVTPQGSVVRATPRGTLAHLAVRAAPHVSWGRAARGGIAALSVFAVLVAGFLALRVMGIGPSGSLLASGKLTAQDRVLVAAFDASSKDSGLANVLSEAVRTNLGQSRAVHVVSTSNIVGALQRMQRKPTERVDVALAREIAMREGIKAVVTGGVTSVGEGYIITTRLISAESGDELAVYRESAANASEIIPTVDRLTRQLRGKIGESLKTVRDAPALSQVTTPSIDALRAFAAGLRANDIDGDYPKAVKLFEDAISKDTNFAAAYVQLAYSLGNSGLRSARTDSLMAMAFRLRDRLPESERYAVEGSYYGGRNRRKAFQSFERAFALDSFNVDVINSLAIGYNTIRDYPRSELMYRRASALEPDNGIILANLSGMLLNAGKSQAVDSIIRLMHDRKIPYPTTRREIDLLLLKENYDSAETLMRGMARSTNVPFAIGALRMLANVQEMRGRLQESAATLREVDDKQAARGNPPSPYALESRLAFDDAWLREKTERARSRLDALLKAHPLKATTEPQDFIDLAMTYAAAGAPQRSREIERQMDAALTDSVVRARILGQRAYLDAEIALAERRAEDAMTASRKADVDPDGLPSGCAFCVHFMLGRSYDQANMADSAIANLERYLKTPSGGRISFDAWLKAPIFKRLGELYEAKGDTRKALEYYGRFVSLWKPADPDLQPKVAEVQARIARLRRTLPQ